MVSCVAAMCAFASHNSSFFLHFFVFCSFYYGFSLSTSVRANTNFTRLLFPESACPALSFHSLRALATGPESDGDSLGARVCLCARVDVLMCFEKKI